MQLHSSRERGLHDSMTAFVRLIGDDDDPSSAEIENHSWMRRIGDGVSLC